MRGKLILAVVTPKLHVKQAAGTMDRAIMPRHAGG